MRKTVYITDNNIAILKEHFGNIEGKGNFPPSINSASLIKDDIDSDEYELGDDGGGMSAYYHVKDGDKLNEWVQYDFDKDRVDRITYSVTVDNDEDGDLEEYEGEVYDTDGRSISYFSGDIDDMRDIFGDKIAEMIAAHEGDYHGGEYHITDIAYMGTSDIDLNNPQEVSNAVKKISKSDGDSYYILTDGTVVGFWDHIEIKAIDGLTISKFLEMGNIRCRHNSVETMKKPTSEQAMVLKGIIRDADQVYVDFSKPNSNGGMYPENVFSVRYANPNPNRIVNDIINYYSNGVKPLGENKKKTITITEEQADSIKRILTESQESKSIAAAKKLVMQKLNYDEQQADEFIRIKLRNDLPALRTPQGGKFILGATRMFCDGELRSANDIGNLNSTLKLVASDAHINEYDRNLNGLSAQDLIQRFSKAMSDNLEAEKEEISQMTFDTTSDYEIVRIDSFEQASQYGKYVSWCVTHDERMFDSYTSDGINQFYFCLKHGFENVKPQPSEGCPLDEYGLSMIAVSVNENGMLNTCTCRWNHNNGGDDSIMSAKEVSQVIGMNFFEAFKPNNKWKELISNVMQRLANGEDPKNIFSTNVAFSEGFAKVKLSSKYNFINQECRFLSDQWFDGCGNFHEGFAVVGLNDKWNFINQEGRFLSDQWFGYAFSFKEGFARVVCNNKFNFINKEGRFLSDQWFDGSSFFSEGFAMVELNDKWNFINQEGRFLSDQWFGGCYDFSDGFAAVELNNKCNFINQEGRFLSNQWFDDAYSFSEGFAVVKLNGKWNFINQEGRFLSNQWFDYAYPFKEGFVMVELNNKRNFINQEGRLLSDQWFDDAYPFSEGFARVELNGKKYRIDTNGNLTPLNESKNVNGNLITENTFESWFRNSVLVDGEGNPIKMYHGTDKEFNAFSKDFIGSTGSFEGYGFNFTPFYGRAVSYNSKNVIEAYLRAERPMTTKSNKITLNMVMKIISELDKGKPYTDTIVAAYESPKYNENWDASYYRRALPVASKVILDYNKENGYGDAGVYAEICVNGNADIKKTIEVFESLGYDSAIFYDNDGRIKTVIVFEPNQIKLTKNTTYNDESEVMSENIEMELDASDVKLDSFKINKSLAPKIWDGLDLNPRVRLRLLDIADDFWETVGVTWVRPCGIKLTGSICNYNWSKFSDIDLHLIVDFSKVDDRVDFVREYFDGKKNEWNNEHEHLKLYSFPVELYVEDIHDETSSDGQYDLEENKWITKPSESFKPIGLDKYYIKNIVSKYATKIEDLRDELEITDDSHKLEALGKKADALWKKIKAMRKYGLQRSGESDPFNIAYKCYRRMGYLDMLFDIKSQQYDKVNSIGINESIDDNIFSKLKAHYGTTYDITECGYVLPDGTMLDFSGKHNVDDVRNKELLRGRRTIDHRDVTSIGVSMSDVIKSGAIRIDCNGGYAALYVRPTREQVDVLKRFIRRNDGCVTIEIGDGDESLSYCEYEDVMPMKVINAILRYFDDGIRLESDIREGNLSPLKESAINDKSLIMEYLEKDHNMPLYMYFKWVNESSQCEKAEDLAYHCSNFIVKYIKRMRDRYSEFGKLVNSNDEFYFEDDEKIEKFCALLKEYDLCDNFIAIMQDIVNKYGWYTELPTWCTTNFIRLVKNEWCIHFTSDADNIANYGLTGGTDDIDHLAYTNAGQEKHQEGYNFAFLIDDRDVDTNEYGNEAVIFRTSGVEIYHYGDMQHQVIFWGPNVKSFIPIKFDGNEGDWVVYGQNGQILKSGNPSDIAEWATENLPQYRKQIMTGKNGYIPQQTIYDPNTYKVSHKPYPLYQNESIQRYLTLLKEEVVADGNADNNVYAKKWRNERETLKRFILQNGTLMTSKENGKTYKVYFDQSLSNLIGINYCICLQYDQYTMDTGNTVYVRALDKFTSRMFRPHFDTRGLDNMSGTNDDNLGNY